LGVVVFAAGDLEGYFVGLAVAEDDSAYGGVAVAVVVDLDEVAVEGGGEVEFLVGEAGQADGVGGLGAVVVGEF